MKALFTLFSLFVGVMAQPYAATEPDNPAVELTNDRYPAVVESFLAKADYEKALYYIEAGLKKNPHSLQLHFQRCVMHELKGEDDAARDAYEAFIKTYPEIPEAANNLAALYAKVGNLDRAEELVKHAIMLRPNFALAYENLANLYLTRAKVTLKAARDCGSETAAERLEALEALAH